jgi:hypothetical protein
MPISILVPIADEVYRAKRQHVRNAADLYEDNRTMTQFLLRKANRLLAKLLEPNRANFGTCATRFESALFQDAN